MTDIYKDLLDGNENEIFYNSSQTYVPTGISYESTYENQIPHETREIFNGSVHHGDVGSIAESGHDYYPQDKYVYAHPTMCSNNDAGYPTNLLSLGPGEYYIDKNQKSDKGTKGLRHFSMKVCEKVQRKGVTSYNEVADELVQELIDYDKYDGSELYDQKNIRRRVYDALNVLMAMNIITKEKKEIRWLGLPTNSIQECSHLQNEKASLIEKVRTKIRELRELIIQHVCLKNLMDRNKEMTQTIPPEFSELNDDTIIKLPFIVINANKQSVIDCAVSESKDEYSFTMNCPFEIHDDIEVLKRIGLSCNLDSGRCTESDVLGAKNLLPKAFGNYVDAIANHTVEEFEQFVLSGNLFNLNEDAEFIPACNYSTANGLNGDDSHHNVSYSSYDYLPTDKNYINCSQRSQDQFRQSDESFYNSHSESPFTDYHQQGKLNNDAFQYPLDDGLHMPVEANMCAPPPHSRSRQ